MPHREPVAPPTKKLVLKMKFGKSGSVCRFGQPDSSMCGHAVEVGVPKGYPDMVVISLGRRLTPEGEGKDRMLKPTAWATRLGRMRYTSVPMSIEAAFALRDALNDLFEDVEVEEV